MPGGDATLRIRRNPLDEDAGIDPGIEGGGAELPVVDVEHRPGIALERIDPDKVLGVVEIAGQRRPARRSQVQLGDRERDGFGFVLVREGQRDDALLRRDDGVVGQSRRRPEGERRGVAVRIRPGIGKGDAAYVQRGKERRAKVREERSGSNGLVGEANVEVLVAARGRDRGAAVDAALDR